MVERRTAGRIEEAAGTKYLPKQFRLLILISRMLIPVSGGTGK